MTKYQRSLHGQKITLKDAVVPEIEYVGKSSNAFASLALICIGIGLGMIILSLVRFCDKPQPEPWKIGEQNRCDVCHNRQMAMEQYFRKNNVKSPELMAEAVLKTRNSRLLAAWNVGGEKKTPHTAMKTGYKKRHSGAWQTAENWGKITPKTSIADQALIAELALVTHVSEEKDIIRGLNGLGGESDKRNGKFAFNVLKELQYGGIP